MTNRGDLPDPLRHLPVELADLEQKGLLRTPPDPLAPRPTDAGAAPRPLLLLCSNDYLGFAAAPWATAPLSPSLPSGSGASRLVTGEHAAHAEAERAISCWHHTEATLLFSSGYAANAGTLAALARPGDVIVSDALNHASIIDGCRLSGARVVVVPHRDSRAVDRALADSADARRRWVVTESYFSMDGDCPDLRALREICDAHDAALYVDEAHAVGVLGPDGRGVCAEMDVRADVLVGTLGKAVGLQGAFVTGSAVLRTYLWNRARSFVFSTGISPALAARVEQNVQRVAGAEGARARDRLDRNVRSLRDGLREIGAPLGPDSRGPILPWRIGPAAAAVAMSSSLREEGILVQAIRPPTVPPDTSRLRITATAPLTEHDLERALRAFARVARALR